MFAVYGVCSVEGVLGKGGGSSNASVCCVDDKGWQCCDKESARSTRDIKRAGVFTGVLCMEGRGVCVGVCLVSAVCGRVGRVRSCGRVGGVITLCEVVGGGETVCLIWA